MASKKMTVAEAIKKFHIAPIEFGKNAGHLYVVVKNLKDKAELMQILPEVKAYFAEKKAAEEAERARRKANVESIPGLAEITKLEDALDAWETAFNKSFNECGGLGVGPRPQGDLDALLDKYPQAVAYRRVKVKSMSCNYELADIGKRALDRFENDPSTWEAIMADVEKEETEFAEEHAWD